MMGSCWSTQMGQARDGPLKWAKVWIVEPVVVSDALLAEW